jgi:hypothetical protein
MSLKDTFKVIPGGRKEGDPKTASYGSLDVVGDDGQTAPISGKEGPDRLVDYLMMEVENSLVPLADLIEDWERDRADEKGTVGNIKRIVDALSLEVDETLRRLNK